jgi:hypothetical protein
LIELLVVIAVIANGLLFPYTKALKLYKCPADRYLSPAQSSAGFTERVRSVSMNAFLKGSALPGQYWVPGFAAYAKESDLTAPAPSQLWVFARKCRHHKRRLAHHRHGQPKPVG